ncbi:MAG: hypothetical protein DLM52_11885, partial [Chthoniobacterales bacterium]
MMTEFFVVGPTAVGKSSLALDVAEEVAGEIVNADAFQIYQGLGILTGIPGAAEQSRVPHHLLGAVPLEEAMSAVRFREMAVSAISRVRARGRVAIVVGGSGLYLKALMDGFDDVPAPDAKRRAELSALSLDELVDQLRRLDGRAAERVDLKNRRRVVRAIEIAQLGNEKQRRRVDEAELVAVTRSGAGNDGKTRSGENNSVVAAVRPRRQREAMSLDSSPRRQRTTVPLENLPLPPGTA